MWRLLDRIIAKEGTYPRNRTWSVAPTYIVPGMDKSSKLLSVLNFTFFVTQKTFVTNAENIITSES